MEFLQMNGIVYISEIKRRGKNIFSPEILLPIRKMPRFWVEIGVFGRDGVKIITISVENEIKM